MPVHLPADLASPRAARRWLADECARRDVGVGVCYSAQLLTTELVTNAVIHAHSAVTLVLTFTTHTLRVDVSDDEPSPPLGREAGDSGVGGRGLSIVDTLSARWGVTGHDGGKTVWFELLR